MPTHTASRFNPPPGVATDRAAGLTVGSVSVLPPPVATTCHRVGNHCGGRSKYWRRTFWRPICLNLASTHASVSSSYLVPEIRPQYWLPSSRLLRETAVISLTCCLRC